MKINKYIRDFANFLLNIVTGILVLMLVFNDGKVIFGKTHTLRQNLEILIINFMKGLTLLNHCSKTKKYL